MQHNPEKKSHSFEKVTEDILDNDQEKAFLTPEAAMRLKFFDDVIDKAVEAGQIDEKTAKIAKFAGLATGRTATLH